MLKQTIINRALFADGATIGSELEAQLESKAGKAQSNIFTGDNLQTFRRADNSISVQIDHVLRKVAAFNDTEDQTIAMNGVTGDLELNGRVKFTPTGGFVPYLEVGSSGLQVGAEGSTHKISFGVEECIVDALAFFAGDISTGQQGNIYLYDPTDFSICTISAQDGLVSFGAHKINPLNLPALAINDIYEVASQAAMLALGSAPIPAEKGDMAIRTDQNNKLWMLIDEDPSVLANWKDISPVNMVTSVNTLTGAITNVAMTNANNSFTAQQSINPGSLSTPMINFPSTGDQSIIGYNGTGRIRFGSGGNEINIAANLVVTQTTSLGNTFTQSMGPNNSSGISSLHNITYTDNTTGTGGIHAVVITRNGSGAGSGGKLAIRVMNGASEVFSVSNTNGAVTITGGALWCNGGEVIGDAGVRAGGSGYFNWTNRAMMQSPADGQIILKHGGSSNFDRLMFGGNTSSFPALKRSSAELQVRLGDDSNYANMRASQFIAPFGFNVNDGAAQFAGSEYLMNSGHVFSWTNAGNIFGTRDLRMRRAAAGVLDIDGGTNGDYRDIRARAFLGQVDSTGVTYKESSPISIDSAVVTGNVFPFDATLTDIIIRSNVSTTTSVEIYSNGVKISGTDPVTLTAATSATKTSFTGWTLDVTKGHPAGYKITANDNATWLDITMLFKRR